MQTNTPDIIAPNQKIKISKKRYLGAVFFGLILILFISVSFDYLLPTIISSVSHEDIASVKLKYDEGGYRNLLLLNLIFSILLGSFLGSFLVRKKGILIGFFISLPMTIIYLGSLLVSFEWFFFFGFLSSLFFGLFGGYLGDKIYSEEFDPDLLNNKRTIFGIRWGHYFWILPLIFSPYLASLLLAMYVFIKSFIVEINFSIHPSLWLSFSYWFFFIILWPLIMSPFYLLFWGFFKFWKLMQIKIDKNKSNKFINFLKIFSCGIIIPIITWYLSNISIIVMDNLPKPAIGDLKIFLWIVGVFLIIIVGGLLIEFFRNKIKNRKIYEKIK